MNRKTTFSLLIFNIFIFIGCEKPIEIDIPQSESKLVVEGWIEQGKGAKILLSMSAPFFATIDSSTLRQYAVTRAKVTLTSGNNSEILTLKPNDVYFPPYYYFSTDIKGELNNEYTIEIRNNGYIYTAKTTIPDLVEPDSVWFEKSDEIDTLGQIIVRVTDNPNQSNYYRTLTKRIGKDKRFVPTFVSVFSDESFNGTTLEIPLTRGNSSLLDIENTRYFQVGDTIILRFCSIDKQHYDFWNSIQGQDITSANPFTVNNADVSSNIGGGLGIWGGYAVSYDTVIAK
jgi:hypothetical protein